MHGRETAALGGGCFWCLEAVYEQMDGVISVQSGYMGGTTERPSYRDVCTGRTGHVEVVEVTFNPAITSYREILEVFFAVHDPTTRDRQGNDVGSQYRSVIFTHSDSQRAVAEQTIRQLEAKHIWPAPIVTDIRPAATFWPAEQYHQEYFRNNPEQPYCAFVIAPKVRKFRQRFAPKLRRPA